MRLFTAALLALALFQAPAAFSQNEQPTLKQVMKQMSKHFKTIEKQIDNPKANSSSATEAKSLAALVFQGISLPPDLSHVPAANQAAALAEYRLVMEKLHKSCLDLERAFLTNDNVLAKKIFVEIEDQKSEGHIEYKE